MSFHPKMPYDTGIQKSERKLPPEGEPFAFTPERRAKFEELATHYPPERRKSAILYAIFMVQEQQGYVSANAMRHVAEVIGCTPAEVDDVVSYYAMFYRQPVGKYVVQVCRTLSCALKGAERVTEEIGEALGIHVGETDKTRNVHAHRSRMPRRLRPRAGRHGERRLARVPCPGRRRRPARSHPRGRRGGVVGVLSQGGEGLRAKGSRAEGASLREPEPWCPDRYVSP